MPLPITLIIAIKNEATNLRRCLEARRFVQRVVVLDSKSTDGSESVAESLGAEVVQFQYRGGYPKKRQWALDSLAISTPWTMFLDADEFVPEKLWHEIEHAIQEANHLSAFFITKGFHFLGRRMRFGGFSHRAVLLFRTGCAQFERIFDDTADGLDMEVHERIIVNGMIGALQTPLVHEDFKGLESYIAKHNKYSTWEAGLRLRYLGDGMYGQQTIKANLFGNAQERRRFLKLIAIRLPCESVAWFMYHYFARLGFLEGKVGLIAARLRSDYIAQVRAKMHEGRQGERPRAEVGSG